MIMKISKLLLCAFLVLGLNSVSFAGDPDEDLASKLATLTIAARQALSAHPDMITDPVASPYTPSEFLKEMRENYKKLNKDVALDEKDDLTIKFLHALRAVVDGAKKGEYKDKWKSDIYPGKFLPARFVKELAESFNKLSKGKYKLKLTVTDDLLVNPANKADAWEKEALALYVSKKKDVTETFFKKDTVDGKETLMALKPEIYKAGCLACHGEEGKKIHAGKVVGVENQVGGAISVVIKK
jgi:dsDNA-binding SOS-regulon protein